MNRLKITRSGGSVSKIKSGGVISMGGGTGGGAFGGSIPSDTIDIGEDLLSQKEKRYIVNRTSFEGHEAESLEDLVWNKENMLIPFLEVENERYLEDLEETNETVERDRSTNDNDQFLSSFWKYYQRILESVKI